MGFTIESLDTIDGNIFNAMEDVIVVPINCVGAMGRGIAKECAMRYPEIERKYKKKCKEQPGCYRSYVELHKVKYGHVLLFATKDHFKDRAVVEMMRNNLKNLAVTACYDWDKIDSIAIPPLGLGAGWTGKWWIQELKKELFNHFGTGSIDVVLYLTPEQMKFV